MGKENTIADLIILTLKESLLNGGLAIAIDSFASLIPGRTVFTKIIKEILKAISNKI